MKGKLWLSFLILMLGLVLLAVGCSNEDNADTAEPGDPTPQASPGVTTPAEDGDRIGNMYKTGLPIVENKITLKVAALRQPIHSKPFDEMLLVQKFEEDTNIHIDWIEVP